MSLRGILQSRAMVVLGVAIAVAVPATTLPRLPQVTLWPLLVGLVPWVIGKYVCCAFRWRALAASSTNAPAGRGWYLRAHAESELLGLLTPGHVGADLWRIKRLTGHQVARGDALMSVAADRFVGALGLAVFMAFAAPDLPGHLGLWTLGLAAVGLTVVLGLRRWRPRLLPSGPLPPLRKVALAFVLAAAYQLTIAGLLLGTVAATGHALTPLEILAAFGASQLAAAVPGVNGASPRDGALVVALVAFGVPLVAAAAAVTIRAAIAWVPALTLGGASLLVLRRQQGRQQLALAA